MLKSHIRAVLGKYTPMPTGGANASGGVSESQLPPPRDAVRLPRNWRNVLSRVVWFAHEWEVGTNEAKACIELDGRFAKAGTLGEGGAAVAVPFDLGGIPLPVLLPTEIAWHAIPGKDDALLWEEHGMYRIQTESGIRVYATRETARIDSYPWGRFLERAGGLAGSDPEYLKWDVFAGPWITALKYAPSQVVELHFGMTEAYLTEVYVEPSPWPQRSLNFELVPSEDADRASPADAPLFFDPRVHASPPVRSAPSILAPRARAMRFRIVLSAKHLHRAFAAVRSESCTISAKGPEDGVFVYGPDGTVVLIAPVAVRPSGTFPVEEEEITAEATPMSIIPARKTLHESLRLLGGTLPAGPRK